MSRGFPNHLKIIHVGQSAIVLKAPGDSPLVSLTDASGGVMPGGLSVPNSHDFQRIRMEASRCVETGRATVFIGAWNQPAAHRFEPVNLSLGVRRIQPEAVVVMLHELSRRRLGGAETLGAHDTAVSAAGDLRAAMDPAPIRARAGLLVSRVLKGEDPGDVLDLLLELVGAGPGTTPTGDDMIVGVLAGLNAVGFGRPALAIPVGPDLTQAFGHDPLGALIATLRPLLPRTTQTSRHYLAAALDGRFGEHVHDLLDSLTDPVLVRPAINRAVGWGSTSGLDLAVGLAALLREFAVTGMNNERICS